MKKLKSLVLFIGLFFVACGSGGDSGLSSENSLTISGEANRKSSVFSFYQFLPKVKNSTNKVLTFTVKNKPLWAEFNTTTGLLSGKVTDKGVYPNISISVSNGKEIATLSPFDIVVTSAIDIAHKYGRATQGTDNSYYYYQAASNAIDNNDTTYNHTRGGAKGENWLQVELPNPTKVSKIVLQNRSHANRLTNAKIYLSNTPYVGSVDVNELVQTLQATNNEQTITLSPAKSGRYLIVKGETNSNDERHIHLKKLEVYGQTSVIPSFEKHETSYLIQGTTTVGTKVATLKAIDYQDDTLTYSIIGSVPFTVDVNGNIIVSGVLNLSTYAFEVEVSDGVNNIRTSVIVNVTSSSVIEDVLSSGDVVHTKVTEEELIQATIGEIESLKVGNSLLSEIYENNSISYSSGNYHSQRINYYGDKEKVFPILYGNKNNILALAGTQEASRISIFASNPFYFFNKSEQLSYEPHMKRILAWLIANKPIDLTIKDNNKTIALSFASNASDVTNWFTTNYPNWTLKNCNDNATLATCYAGADLVILGNSSADTIADAVALKTVLPSLLRAGKPLLYTHPNWGENALSNVIEDVFELSFPYGGNYWADDSVRWNSSSEMQRTFFNHSGYASIETMFNHFKELDYSFDWSKCKDSKGVHDKNSDDCSEVVGLSSEFQEGATVVRNLMNGLDSVKKNIFLKKGYRLQKLLALTADKFRQSVSYPMDKVTTDDNEFIKSYYADHVIYNYRMVNPKQLDMGNFSRSDFSHIIPTIRRVQINSKKFFRSTGAYALPGQTVRVTRNDSSDLTVKVFINSLRSGATHQFQKNGYSRPKYLQTPHFEIKSGETITFTSPYGGPLQLEFSKNDLPIDITFKNIGEHPYWANSADNASFTEKMDANEYDWAEIATAGFTVHSKRDKMVESISDTRWGGTAEGLANAVVKYTSNYPHVLAGFKGEGIDKVPEINDWAIAKGLTIETIDIMKHMNADQATCGYGCSGNPYDAYWAFSPIGHGDIHEMGHSLQMMRFEGFPNHAATNTFSYYTKSRYFDNTGGENNCGGQPFKYLFETVQASVGEANVTEYLKTNLWDKAGLGEQYLLKIEAMMHAQKMGKIQNGWHILARVHILEREMKRAKKDWEAQKASVGFSTYSLNEINAIGNNDWLVVAYSYTAEVDFRDYFDMMGISYSQKARNQIASFGFDVAPKALFVSTPKGYCSEDKYGRLFDRPSLPIDGTTVYSY